MKKLSTVLISTLLFSLVWIIAPTAEASASLTISSASIDTTGKTVTVNIGGVSGTLSPTTGVTGFTLVITTGGHTTPMQTATTTASGAVVTIPLSGIILSAESVTLNLATSTASNLTDTGGNTPTGQTGVSVTNNSTVSGSLLPISNSNIWQMGYCTASSGVAGHNIQRCFGFGSRLDMIIHGTDADVQLYNAGGAVTISVDGNATTTTLSANATYPTLWFPIFSGLSNTNHTVQINNSDSTNFGIYDSDNTIRIAGSGLSSEPSYYALATVIGDNVGSGAIRVDGSPGSEVSNGYPYLVKNAPNGIGSQVGGGNIVLRFRATTTDISLWAYPLYAGGWNVFIDGATTTPTTSLAHGADAHFSNYHIASGLDGSTSHLYEISEYGIPNEFDLYYSVMLAGGAGLVSSALPGKNTLGMYGDSITLGSGLISVNDATKIDGWIVAREMNMGYNKQGYGGQCVSGPDTDSTGLCTKFLRNNTSFVTSYLSPLPTIIFANGGVNDQAHSVSTTTFQSDMQTMLSNLAGSSSPGTILLVRGVLPNSTTSSTRRSLYQTAQSNATTAYMVACGGGCTKPAYFFNTDNWLNTTTDMNGDGLHPVTSGYAKIANREIPIVNGYLNGSSFSASGPSSGTTGHASTNFTVLLPGEATFTGDQTITISDGGNGGTITPSVGSPGTSSITVTPTASLTSFTFTYTPVSTGVKTLTFTDGQDAWVNPSALTYTSSSSNIVTLKVVGIINGRLYYIQQ